MARSRDVPVSGVPEAPAAAAVSRFLAEPGLGARRPSAQCGHGCFCACSHDPPLEPPLGPRGIVAFKALCGIRAPRGVGRSASMSLQRRPIVTFFTAVTATSSRLRGCAPGPAKRADCRPNVGLGGLESCLGASGFGGGRKLGGCGGHRHRRLYHAAHGRMRFSHPADNMPSADRFPCLWESSQA